MQPFPPDTPDAELIRFVDGWASLLEQEDYEAAFRYTDHVSETAWSPHLIREVIKSYDRCRPDQRVTLDGQPTDVVQRKVVMRRSPDARGFCGVIWYDLNIDGLATDLTATFHLRSSPAGSLVCLNEIYVM